MTAAAPTASPVSLAQVQHAMASYILQGQHPDAAAMVRPHGALTVEQRLQIYHQAYRWRLLEALQDHYAQTLVYMGDEFFESEALAYIEAHPPETDNLRHYGAHWVDWLSQRYPQDLDMADLARLEWALRHAFDAGDAPALSWQGLAHLDAQAWQALHFDLAPGTCVLTMTHNVGPLWQALSQVQTPDPVQPLMHEVLVWRQGWQPHFRSMTPPEAAAVRLLQAGHPFEAACTQALACAAGEADEHTAMQWLQRWMAEQLLAGYRTA